MYRSGKHCKYYLKYHVILVVKYRHKLLNNTGKEIKELIMTSGLEIEALEVDKDHVHFVLVLTPEDDLKKAIFKIKQRTTYYIWQEFPEYLRKYFWYKNVFWSDSYFVCTLGEVSVENIKKYIENQGK